MILLIEVHEEVEVVPYIVIYLHIRAVSENKKRQVHTSEQR